MHLVVHLHTLAPTETDANPTAASAYKNEAKGQKMRHRLQKPASVYFFSRNSPSSA
jgi:hypothetical protein